MTACFLGILVVVLHLTLTPNTPLPTQCPARNPSASEHKFTDTQDWINHLYTIKIKDLIVGLLVGIYFKQKNVKLFKLMLLIYQRC
jgi:hypothetical protein